MTTSPTTSPIPSLASLGTDAAPAIGRHFDRTFRTMARSPHVTQTPRFMRLSTGEMHPFGNLAVVASPVDLDIAREAVGPLVEKPVPAAVIFPELEVPTDVDAWLTAEGFAGPSHMPAMGIDIAALGATSLPDGYEFVRVGTGADGDAWVRTFAAGYDVPLSLSECFSPARLPADMSPDANVQFFGVRRIADGEIVCTSALVIHGGLAGIYNVATVPAERRKGLGAHATAEPLRLAAARGYTVGILQASAAGHPIYRALGFSDCGVIPMYVRMPH